LWSVDTGKKMLEAINKARKEDFEDLPALIWDDYMHLWGLVWLWQDKIKFIKEYDFKNGESLDDLF